MNLIRKRIMGAIFGVLLLITGIPAFTSLAYSTTQFGYNENGGAFTFTGSNYYYSPILAKSTSSYVKANVIACTPVNSGVGFVICVRGQATASSNATHYYCGKRTVYQPDEYLIANTVYESGYAYCRLMMWTTGTTGGVCYGTWQADCGEY